MAYTDRDDLNYLGQLYLIGANQTPLLNMLGGLAGGGGLTTNSFKFPVAQPWTLNSASQPAITEASAVSGQTATTYTRAQDTNAIQIHQQTYQVSYAKRSTYAEISGLSQTGNQPVRDELVFQREGNLRQIAIDMEYSMFQGSYQDPTGPTVAGKTRGLSNAISTNTVAAGSVQLTKALIDELLKEMATNGSTFQNMILFCNAFQKQKVSDIYGYAPEDRNVGGLNIKQVETDFCMVGIQYAPQMPTDEIYIVDMSVMNPIYCPVGGKVFIDEPLAKDGASDKNQLYTQFGLDYGPEEYHGSVTGLSTS